MGTLGNKWLILCRSNNCVSNSSCLHMLNGFLSSQTRLDTVSLIKHAITKISIETKKQKHMLYASCAIWNTTNLSIFFYCIAGLVEMCGLKLGGLSSNCKHWYSIIPTMPCCVGRWQYGCCSHLRVGRANDWLPPDRRAGSGRMMGNK